MFSDLLRDSRFWAAVVALANVVLFFFVPTFPKEIWAAINAVLAVVIGTLATKGAVGKRQARRAAQVRANEG
jgi:type III secretory pathway component EscV